MANVLHELETNLRAHGYVGDTKPAKLTYLSLVSALLDDPVSLLLKGSSGSGKSHALGCGKRYVPDTAYEEFHGMSEHALPYMANEVDLKHKSLIIQEAAGFDKGNGRVFLRQLLTEGKIKYVTVNNTSDKGLKAEVLKPLEGPCGLLMTTTANSLHHEDENRMLSYTIAESPGHVGEVLMAQALSKITEPSSEELIPWHERYERVRQMTAGGSRVVVPYATAIIQQMDTRHIRLMRDFRKVLSLIQTLALLHENERGTDESGNIVASPEDYAAVHDLVDASLSEGLKVAVSPGVRAVVDAVRELRPAGQPNLPFDGALTMAVLADHMGIDRSTVSRNAMHAVREEFLINDNPGQGKPADLRLGPRVIPTGHALPAPDELDFAIAEAA